ncbi:MAG: hypothetical protein HYR66_08315 [Sphingobacteriales bacterium]|nr:hypothetical protein [Sphingobacteriales bacterium]MBI3718769.1 hypothetical protein [Sphingobacteriales bacterium]
MKKNSLLISLLIIISIFCTAQTPDYIVKRFKLIVALIQKGNTSELSKLIQYPLKREYPLADISTSKDFISKFDTLFDADFKQLLKTYNDSVILTQYASYGLVGGDFSGEIWINEKGKVITVNYSSAKEQELKNKLIADIKSKMHPSVRDWDYNVLVAKSKNLLIRIDETKNGLRYISWGKGKNTSDLPDLILYKGVAQQQGTEGGFTWTFKNNDWTYVVDQADICETPVYCGLFLRLLFKEEEKQIIRLERTK